MYYYSLVLQLQTSCCKSCCIIQISDTYMQRPLRPQVLIKSAAVMHATLLNLILYPYDIPKFFRTVISKIILKPGALGPYAHKRYTLWPIHLTHCSDVTHMQTQSVHLIIARVAPLRLRVYPRDQSRISAGVHKLLIYAPTSLQ